MGDIARYLSMTIVNTQPAADRSVVLADAQRQGNRPAQLFAQIRLTAGLGIGATETFDGPHSTYFCRIFSGPSYSASYKPGSE